MSTNKDKDPDYHAFMRDTSPDPKKISDRTHRLQRQQASLKTKISIRIDADLLDDFKRLARDNAPYQSLINRALRDWLAKQSLKELLREELLPLLALSKDNPTSPSLP